MGNREMGRLGILPFLCDEINSRNNNHRRELANKANASGPSPEGRRVNGASNLWGT